MRPTYCRPSECGLQSEGRAVAKRLARLLNGIESDITKWVVDGVGPGTIEHDLWNFKLELMRKLREDGWRIEAKDAGGYRVRVPKDYLK